MKICATDVDNLVQNRCTSNHQNIWNASIVQCILDVENVANVKVTTNSKDAENVKIGKHL
jgi:hypothetical protein